MLVAETVAPKKTVIEEKTDTVVDDDSILVRVHHVAVCGTDLHVWDDSYVTTLPVVQGHEFSGVIEAIGANVTTDLHVGQHVAINPSATCGKCYACRIGRYNCCTNLVCIGCWPGKDGVGTSADAPGGMQELLNIAPDHVFALPDDLPLDIAALTEPMGIATQAVNRSGATSGETALVIGAGPIGILATVVLKDRGCQVIVADIDESRARAALDFGADDYIVSGAEFPTQKNRELLEKYAGKDGVHIVIEATGVPSCGVAAIDLVSPAGRIVQVGISARPLPVDISKLALKEITLCGSRNHHGFPEAIDLVSRHREDVKRLITHHFPIDDINQAFEMITQKTEPVGKVVFDMPASKK